MQTGDCVISGGLQLDASRNSLMSKRSHECENVFAAVFAHYLLGFDVRNKVLNRNHESHHCILSAQAQLGKGRRCRCQNELNTPHVNRLQCTDRKRQGDYEWFGPKNLPLYVMDRLP